MPGAKETSQFKKFAIGMSVLFGAVAAIPLLDKCSSESKEKQQKDNSADTTVVVTATTSATDFKNAREQLLQDNANLSTMPATMNTATPQ